MKTKTSLGPIRGSNICMGDRVRDPITGFEGIVVTHVRHLTGCDTVWVKSQDPKIEADKTDRHFDIVRLDLVDKNPLSIQEIPNEVPSSG